MIGAGISLLHTAASGATATVGSVAGMARGILPFGILRGATGAAGKLASFGGSAVVAVGKSTVSIGGKFISGGVSVSGNALKVAAYGVNKANYRVQYIVRGSLWAYNSLKTIIFAILTFICLLYLDYVGWFLEIIAAPFVFIFRFIQEELFQGLKFARDLRDDGKSEASKPWTFQWFISHIMEFFAILLLELFEFFSAFVKSTVNFIEYVFRHPQYILGILLADIVFSFIEQNYVLIFDALHYIVIGSENAVLTAFNLGNVALDVHDLVQPITNEYIYNSIDVARVLCDSFCPEDMSITGSSSGRRLQTTSEDIATRISSLQSTVTEVVYAQHEYHQFENGVLGLFLILVKPFLALILAIIEAVFSKLACAMTGGILCTALEILNFIGYLAVEALNGIFGGLGVNIAPPQAGCTAGGLPYVDPGQCGGWMSDSQPPGAFFANLKPTIGRRLETEKLITCVPHPHDNSWVESVDGVQVHRSEVHKCPLSRHIFRDELENVRQLNSLKIQEECYQVCLHGVLYQACHTLDDGLERRFLGSCSEETSDIKDENQARRRLVSIFPDTYFSGFSPERKTAATTPNIFSPEYIAEFTDTMRKENMNSKKLADDITAILGPNPDHFTAGGIECTMLHTNPTIVQSMVNHVCIGLKIVVDRMPSMRHYAQRMVGTRGRRLSSVDDEYEESAERDEKEEEKQASWRRRFLRRQSILSDTFATLKHHLKVLHATDEKKPLTARIDDMVSITSYKPRGRRLTVAMPQEATQLAPLAGPDNWCIGDDSVYPCITGECVPYAQRDLCPDPGANASTIQQIGYAIHTASLYNIDPETLFQSAVACQQGYQTNPSTLPLTYANLQSDGANAEYCMGLAPSVDFRLPSIQIMGINRLITTGCNVNNSAACSCDFYYSTTEGIDGVGFGFVSQRDEYEILNSLMSVQFMIYLIVFINWPFYYAQWAWYWLWSWFGEYNLPLWFLYILGDQGLHKVSIWRRVFCFFMKAGSLVTLLILAYFLYVILISIDPLRIYFFALGKRLSVL